LKPLHKLTVGEKAFIIDMRNAHLCMELFERGVFPGDMVEIKENSAENNSIVVNINNHTFNIFRKAAATIITNVVSYDFSLN
jgi:Fe2+ transport system protein FeoA